MILKFEKFHGAGNDFIISASEGFTPTPERISMLCDRNKGIGADGFILVKKIKKNGLLPFLFFNNDGGEAECCGNGLRCAALFCSKALGLDKMTFSTKSGKLCAEIVSGGAVRTQIPINKYPEKNKVLGKKAFFSVVGVPHLVVPVTNLKNVDVAGLGRKLRFHSKFRPAGTNVDFVELKGCSSFCEIRTYERGVEAETSACGTGAVATAFSLAVYHGVKFPVTVKTLGGEILKVELEQKSNRLPDVKRLFLTGPAKKVFSGLIKI